MRPCDRRDTRPPRIDDGAIRIRFMTQDLKDRKAQQAIEGAKAMAEYKAAVEARARNTARLRAERLAREAAALPARKKAASS